MVEEAVQGAEAGAGAGGGVDAEGEEAFSKLDAFPQEKMMNRDSAVIELH